MAEKIRIQTPLTEEQSRKLKAGDSVLITGTIYSDDQIVYYLGPSPAKPGDPIGSAGPTTSGRMDAYTPTMLDQGIKGMIGKGSRKPEVVESMKKNGTTYFAAVGGAAALIAKSIKKYEVIAYPELGPEALAALTVEDFPAIVVIDTEGNNFYEIGQKPYREI